jgi:hypothetical protein
MLHFPYSFSCRTMKTPFVMPTPAEQKAEMRAALTSPDFSHTRCHSVNPDSVSAYRYDSESPSGFMLITSLRKELYAELEAEMVAGGVKRHGGFAPLSPTERR